VKHVYFIATQVIHLERTTNEKIRMLTYIIAPVIYTLAAKEKKQRHVS